MSEEGDSGSGPRTVDCVKTRDAMVVLSLVHCVSRWTWIGAEHGLCVRASGYSRVMSVKNPQGRILSPRLSSII